MIHGLGCLAAALAVICLPALPSAGDIVTVNGRVLASDGKAPLEGAALAVYGGKGEVIAHGRTGADGRYSIEVPRGALHLSPKRGGGGLLGAILGGVAKLTSIAATVAPLAMGPAGATSALAGSASQVANGLLGGGPASNRSGPRNGPDSNQRLTAAQIQQMRRMMPKGTDTEVFDSVFDAYAEAPADPTANSPGALVLRVTHEGCAETGGVAQIYWIQEAASESGNKEGATAWVDPILLSKYGEAAASRIVRGYFVLAHGNLSSAIVEVGHTVTISAELPMPDEPKVNVVVVARDANTGEVFELQPHGGVYSAEFLVDGRFPKGEQLISILAYAAEASGPGRSKKAEDAIAGAGMWKLDKNFEYNPRIVASRNRLDVRLTVVDPGKTH